MDFYLCSDQSISQSVSHFRRSGSFAPQSSEQTQHSSNSSPIYSLFPHCYHFLWNACPLHKRPYHMGNTLVDSTELTLILLTWRIGRAPNSISIYSCIQKDATSHSLFISGKCSTCFGWYFHPPSGAHTTASTASGICHTVTAICRYRGRVETGLSVLWVAYAKNPA
jgi:hypothetical protein